MPEVSALAMSQDRQFQLLIGAYNVAIWTEQKQLRSKFLPDGED